MMKRAVFLDRNNTLIEERGTGENGQPQFALIKGAASAIASLQGLGFRLVIVTNEPLIAAGRHTEAEIDALHDTLAQAVEQNSGARIDRFYYCPFEPGAKVVQFAKDHPWRKPHAGMWQQAASDLDLDLRLCWTIGRQGDDIAAGRAAGTRTVLLDPRGRESEIAEQAQPDFVANTLIEAARIIAQQRPVPLDAREVHSADSAEQTSPRRGKLYPANQPLQDGPTSSRPARKNRPFVPWSIQPDAEGDHPPLQRKAPATPETQSPPAEPPSAPSEASSVETTPQPPAAAPPAPAPPRAAPAPPASTPPAPPQNQPPSPRGTEAPTVPKRPTPSKSLLSARSPELPDSDASEISSHAPGEFRETNALLRQILTELKAQRVDSDDFSMDKIVAGVAQMGAIGCVIIGLIVQFTMGGDFIFIQWLAGGIFLQLLVVAMLLLKVLK